MIQKTKNSIIGLTILLFFLTLQNTPVAVGIYVNSCTDPENDVLRSSDDRSNYGDYKDEIDLIRIDIDGQHVNVTLAGDTEAGSINNQLWISVYLFQNYDTKKDPACQAEYYIYYNNFSKVIGYDVFFIKAINPVGCSWTPLYWNGTEFESTTSPRSIGNVTNNLIQAFIPSAAWIIPDNLTYYANSVLWEPYEEYYYYEDYAPDQYGGDDNDDDDDDDNEGNDLGYDLFIILSAIIGISLIIMRKIHKKRFF